MTTQSPTHQAVKEHYGKMAREASAACDCSPREQTSSCCDASSTEDTQNFLYPEELLTGMPTDIVNFSAGSGDPITLARLQPGEMVLDLGSGGGLDCFLAARAVGPKGQVIGVDMTPEMLARASQQAARLKLSNVIFRQGYLEDLPVDDASMDVIISNCVVNLSPDKPKVLSEMLRVLKPGGRIALSDMVANHPISEEARQKKEDWCACTTGAMHVSQYMDELQKAGFVDINIKPNIEVIRKAIETGRVRTDANRTTAQLLEELKHFEAIDRLVVAPHQITASRPA